MPHKGMFFLKSMAVTLQRGSKGGRSASRVLAEAMIKAF
jgi:hypothetical protein